MYKLEMKRWNRNLRTPKSYIFTCENIIQLMTFEALDSKVINCFII